MDLPGAIDLMQPMAASRGEGGGGDRGRGCGECKGIYCSGVGRVFCVLR